MRARTFLLGCMIAGAAALPSPGMFSMPTDMPVGRVIANVGAYVKEHPNDAAGYYVLGRAHALAYTLKTRSISVWARGNKSPLPEITSDDFQTAQWRTPASGGDPPPIRAELLEHLRGAIENLAKAVELNAAPAERSLSYAYVLDQGAKDAPDIDVLPPSPGAKAGSLSAARQQEINAWISDLGSKDASAKERARKSMTGALEEAAPVLHERRKDADKNVRDAVRELLTRYWKDRAIVHYLGAFSRAIKQDLAITQQPMRGLRTLIGYEAGQGFIRLVKERGARDKAEETALASVQADLKTLDDKPPNGAITPMIFAVDRPAELPDLLSRETACFDLDGDGRAEAWPWVRPDTGILVWDPSGTGAITSGRQLFGNATWWMLFSSGYQAMDALDDDRNGWLEGNELRGLAVWFDVNGNGVSDLGEVVPVERVGIAALATSATSTAGDSPANHAGLIMRNGSVLPTYDWTVAPAGRSREEPACEPRDRPARQAQ